MNRVPRQKLIIAKPTQLPYTFLWVRERRKAFAGAITLNRFYASGREVNTHIRKRKWPKMSWAPGYTYNSVKFRSALKISKQFFSFAWR